MHEAPFTRVSKFRHLLAVGRNVLIYQAIARRARGDQSGLFTALP